MKTKRVETRYPAPKPSALVLNDATDLSGVGLSIPVRAAKAKFSALLELVASGQEVVITSDGKPKAKLMKAETREPGKVFQGMGDYLMKQPIHGGPTADEIIRADRDSRP
jgi:prevent-host-death family protein